VPALREEKVWRLGTAIQHALRVSRDPRQQRTRMEPYVRSQLVSALSGTPMEILSACAREFRRGEAGPRERLSPPAREVVEAFERYRAAGESGEWAGRRFLAEQYLRTAASHVGSRATVEALRWLGRSARNE
jgi:hypothetical protein